MTGQPETEEELTNATQNANAELSKKLESGEIERGFDDVDDNDDDDESNLEELRNFRENVREQGNDELGVYGEPQTDGGERSEMVVTENGETQTFTREEWENERGAKTRIWDRLERFGGSYVKVANWFSDSDVNAVKVGDGFYGEKVDETEKAYKFVCEANSENHTAESREVWVPKSAVRTHALN